MLISVPVLRFRLKTRNIYGLLLLLVSHRITIGLSFEIRLAPGIAPPNVRMQQLRHNRLLVTWDSLPDNYANGDLRGYLVYYREYKNQYEWSPDDGELGESVNVSSSETQVVLNDLDGGRKYQISVAAFTVDVGPRSEWQAIIIG